MTGRAEYNPAPDLISAMQGHESNHYPFLNTYELPAFFESLSQYSVSLLVVLAARLLILTGVRTGELRGATWQEIETESAVWTIPAERMKMRRPHIVPVSRQALVIIERIRVMARRYPLIFPGRNEPRKTMSEASINQVFKRIGYTGRVNGHGFRHTMNTILHEQVSFTTFVCKFSGSVINISLMGSY